MWMEHSAGKQRLWELHRCVWVLILGLSMGSDRSTGGLMVPSPSSWCRGCAPTRGVEGRVVELKLLGTSKFDEALKTNPLSRLADAGHTLTPACGVVARAAAIVALQHAHPTFLPRSWEWAVPMFRHSAVWTCRRQARGVCTSGEVQHSLGFPLR